MSAVSKQVYLDGEGALCHITLQVDLHWSRFTTC